MQAYTNLLTGEYATLHHFSNGWTVCVFYRRKAGQCCVTIMPRKLFDALMRDERQSFYDDYYTDVAMTKRGDYFAYVLDDDELISIMSDVASRPVADGTVDASAMLNKVLKR